MSMFCITIKILIHCERDPNLAVLCVSGIHCKCVAGTFCPSLLAFVPWFCFLIQTHNFWKNLICGWVVVVVGAEYVWRCILRQHLVKVLAATLGIMSVAIVMAEATLLFEADLSLFSVILKMVDDEVLLQVGNLCLGTN